MASLLVIPTITLTPTERKIRTLLVDYANFKKAQTGVTTELRVSGGWVRDKVLGKESNDLDIAINNLTGEEFARGLMNFITEHAASYVGAIKKTDLVHTIASNPEKSKHLETCTTKLYGLDIDFVNLRSEEYTDTSRIPVIQFGTPLQDALRRDATLNALFFNLQEEAVEDYTGRGLMDLQQGILRTPLQPFQTFLDDPLRVLRLIRFASRFGFTIERESLAAMATEETRLALGQKISRERIGVEVEKVLQGPNPGYGLRLMLATGLYEAIFNMGAMEAAVQTHNPDKVELLRENTLSSAENCLYSIEILPVMGSTLTHTPTAKVVASFTKEPRMQKLFWLMVAAQPLQTLTLVTNPKKRATLAVELMIKEGVKLGNKDAEPVAKIITTQTRLTAVVDRFIQGSTSRSEVGLMVREYGEWWPMALAFNAFCEFLERASAVIPASDGGVLPIATSGLTETNRLELTAIAETALVRYNALFEYIETQGLRDAFTWKHILDGKVLIKTLGLKPGPWMKTVGDEVMRWQLDNPSLSKEDAVAYIKNEIHRFV